MSRLPPRLLLARLAEGIDPFTGEVIDEASPLRRERLHPETPNTGAVALLRATRGEWMPGERPRPDGEVWGAVDTLTPRTARILSLRFGRDGPPETLAEIGLRYGLTRERIRQIVNKGLRGLAHPSRRTKLWLTAVEQEEQLDAPSRAPTTTTNSLGRPAPSRVEDNRAAPLALSDPIERLELPARSLNALRRNGL